MKNATRFGTRSSIRIATLVAVACAGAQSAGALAEIAPPMTPPALAAPAGNTVTLQVRATGTQIYSCKDAPGAAGKFEWRFVAPEAELFDAGAKKLGRHYAGPSWEMTDGSKVVGEVAAKDDGPDPAAIAWLLLKAKSVSGKGVLSNTTFIQRINTEGGKAPASGCDAAHKDASAAVPYKAIYVFYSAGK